MGALPDAVNYHDEGCNTLRSVSRSAKFCVPTLARLGLFHIDGIPTELKYHAPPKPLGSFARLAERSQGKDTTIGHWEIAGLVTQRALPTYPNGFPETILDEFARQTGRKVLCNQPYSGTQVLLDYAPLQKEAGGWIVYTSADSVFQIAAHEAWIGLPELYHACEIARGLLCGEHRVGRVIARPFTGEYPNYTRTKNRHDYSLQPPESTMLDTLQSHGFSTIGIGKIADIFAGRGISDAIRSMDNHDGMMQTMHCLDLDFEGLCFVNLVDFDMNYGHRNDVDGYAHALNQFDVDLCQLIKNMAENDILIISADHGCDPGKTGSTDHTREYAPLLIYGDSVRGGINLGTQDSFTEIAKLILTIFGIGADESCLWTRVCK